MKQLRMMVTLIITGLLVYVPFLALKLVIPSLPALLISVGIALIYLFISILRILSGNMDDKPKKNMKVMSDRTIRCYHCGNEFEAAFVGDRLAMSVNCPNCNNEINETNVIPVS